MKLLLIILFLCSQILCFQTSFAKSSPPVKHSHSGRAHNHSLPNQGLAHRHGSSAQGIADGNTNIRTTPIVKNSPAVKTIQSNILSKALTNCHQGDMDCNVCAANVQQQFNRAVSGKISWQNKAWRFSWPQSYPPYNKRPLDIFDGDPAYALGIPDTHVQGFVRTHSSRFPYAGSHSHKRQGGVFVITQHNDGKKYLATLHPSKSKHPSGVHILGKYLVYGENRVLVFKDLNSPQQQHDITLAVPGSTVNFGGGIGLIKLSKDRHLLILSGPGGQDRRPRFHRFYLLKSLQGRPHHLTFINQSRSQKPEQWSRGFAFSENLSAITECGTGDIYTIHTSGDEKGIRAINGNGYWRLSKLEQHQGKLQLKAINGFSSKQNMSSCNVRAAATVYVTPQHHLEFYCHGYAKDPDGSMFNVLGSSSRGKDKFYFRTGVLR
ncbi:MAG: hypothetical protein V3U84_00740 [Thiotrichaceae bacterium]